MTEFIGARLRELHNAKLPSDKVYVCGKSGPGGSILGEAYVQDLMKTAGFWLFKPQDYPFSFQLYVYTKAKHIVFSEGSAVHSTALLGRASMNDVTLIVRRPASAGMFKDNLYGHCKNIDIALVSSFLGTIVIDPTHHVPAKHLGVSLYNVEAIKHFFGSRGFWQFYGFDRDLYYAQCEEDLRLYIRHFIDQKAAFHGFAALGALLNRYELCKSSDVN